MRPAAKTDALDRAAVVLDGGMCGQAIAAITALPPGPRREFEVATWARRVLAGPGRLAFVVPDGVAADAAIAALGELDAAIRREVAGARGRQP